MSANKECELPGADSCAIMEGEGEEVEDDIIYTKPSLLAKLKAIATKVHTTSHDTAVELCVLFFQYVLPPRIQVSVWTSDVWEPYVYHSAVDSDWSEGIDWLSIGAAQGLGLAARFIWTHL